MSDPESPVGPALLVVHSGESSHAIAPGGGVVTIGNEPQADVRIDDPQIPEAHLQAVSDDGRWRIVDSSQSGMFVDGRRESSVTVSDKTTVRFGDPTGGKALTFEIVRPSSSPEPLGDERRPAEELTDRNSSRTRARYQRRNFCARSTSARRDQSRRRSAGRAPPGRSRLRRVRSRSRCSARAFAGGDDIGRGAGPRALRATRFRAVTPSARRPERPRRALRETGPCAK